MLLKINNARCKLNNATILVVFHTQNLKWNKVEQHKQIKLIKIKFL